MAADPLQGKWLQDLGFQSGDKIAIEERSGALLIKAVTDEITIKGKGEV